MNVGHKLLNTFGVLIHDNFSFIVKLQKKIKKNSNAVNGINSQTIYKWSTVLDFNMKEQKNVEYH